MQIVFFGALSALVLSSLLTAVASAMVTCALRPKAFESTQKEAIPRVAASWYAGWRSADLPPENISWNKYTIVTYSFALTTPDASMVLLQASDEALLPRFVKAAHDHNVKASLTIGGWTGSRYFSSAVAAAQNRTAFVKAVLNLVQKYQLDAIDFDWEYPGKQGLGCNVVSPNDSANFLAFLQELRTQPAGRNLIVTAAVSIKPFTGPDGNPMSDVSAFAKVLDYVAIMDYDIWGSWSPLVGPNAPLDDTCSNQKQGSAVSAVASWTAAKFPAKQLVLGVPAYGHSFRVEQAAALPTGSGEPAAYPPFDPITPKGDRLDQPSTGVDECGKPASGGYSGLFNFWGLIEEGFLTGAGVPANGISSRFDQCSQTPFVYNRQTQVMVSYDDARSFEAKGSFITAKGLAGFSMWDASGDYKDILLDAIIKGLGGKAPTHA